MTQTVLAPNQVGVSPFDLRRGCGPFGDGVTIVTVCDGEAERGMTADSFTSVSFDPPLVVVSIDTRHRTHQLVSTQGKFAVNVLAREQRAWLDRFARRDADSEHQFDDVPHRLVDGLPVFDDATAVLICEVTAVHPAGDHTLFVGEVKHLEWTPGDTALAFYGSQDFGLGSVETLRIHEMAC